MSSLRSASMIEWSPHLAAIGFAMVNGAKRLVLGYLNPGLVWTYIEKYFRHGAASFLVGM